MQPQQTAATGATTQKSAAAASKLWQTTTFCTQCCCTSEKDKSLARPMCLCCLRLRRDDGASTNTYDADISISFKASTFGSWTPEEIKNQNSYLKC